MLWIVCWFRDHLWKNAGTALSHPDRIMWVCARCGKRESVPNIFEKPLSLSRRGRSSK